jgi:hypothetical protein
VLNENHTKTERSRPNVTHVKAYDHTRHQCSQQPKRIKRSEDLLTEKCTKDRSLPVICTLCSGAYTISYKGCVLHTKTDKIEK